MDSPLPTAGRGRGPGADRPCEARSLSKASSPGIRSSMRTSMAGAVLILVGGLFFAVPACGPAAGDPCVEGDECGGDLYCFDDGTNEPSCQEFPAACDGVAPCDCEELTAECEQGFSCVSFGDITAVACN